MAWLIVTSGAAQSVGQSFNLDKCPLSIGRDVTQDIQIVDAKVSKRHATVRRDGEGYVIAEKSAKNGIYVNGKRAAEATLSDGDRIVLGETQLTFRLTFDPAEINALKKERVMSRATREATQGF